MSTRAPAVQTLLRQLDLSSNATKAEIRAAYLKKVKVLHPDIAGKSAEERFRQLKDDYEKAMEQMRKGYTAPSQQQTYSNYQQRPPNYHAYGAGPGAGAYQYAGAGARARTNQNEWSSATADPGLSWADLTPAQRIRNVAIGAFGVLGCVFYMMQPSSRRSYASQASVANSSSSNARSTSSDGSGAPLVRKFSDMQVEPISDYYKKRSTKSTVRVRGSDTYLSPSEPAKSRLPMGGVQYDVPVDAASAATATRGAANAPAAASVSAPAAPTTTPIVSTVPAAPVAQSAAAPGAVSTPPEPPVVIGPQGPPTEK
eukprot:TRINITY_DN13190_c0_g1_i1.p1 TRINITY_DN13190_c0_g1~~TRINITY_DN13190_c0_g1_i1.p1  ORF type:complete len:313 (+),score=67.03 TRINITY_DN13190_c0_g1_i1:82-1020(+)